MEPSYNKSEDTKGDTQKNDHQANDAQMNSERTIAEVSKTLEFLFEPNHLWTNSYLLSKASPPNFQIPIRFIYEENSVKARTIDRAIVNEAIARTHNVVAIKRNDVIEAIEPKVTSLKKDISVSGITKQDEKEFKEFVYNFEGAADGIISWSFNPQIDIINIICKDEEFAAHLYNHLISSQFKDSAISANLNSENLYIAALEHNKTRDKKYMGGYQPPRYPMNMYSPYMSQGFFLNPLQGSNPSYMKNNYYPSPMPFYNQQPMMYGNPMMQPNQYSNNSINGSNNMNRSSGFPHRGGGEHRGGRYRGGRGGRGRGGRGGYRGNGYRQSSEQPKIEVNENEFPPLSNENQGDQE